MNFISQFTIDTYNFHLLVLGIITLLAATVPNILSNRNITAPIIYLLIGVGIYLVGNRYSTIAALNNVDVIKNFRSL